MLIIFDWDGTLCDSSERIVAAMSAAARDLGHRIPEPCDIENIIGLGLPEAMAALFVDSTPGERSRLQQYYSRRFRELDNSPSPLFPEVRETLADLRLAGHLLAVATGKSRKGLDRVLNGLNLLDYFDASRCADETRSKPDPEMLHQLLHETGVHHRDAVMVGDTEYDLQMAASAGVASIGVSFGVHSTSRLRQHAPGAIIDSMGELLDLIIRHQGINADVAQQTTQPDQW